MMKSMNLEFFKEDFSLSLFLSQATREKDLSTRVHFS